MYTVIGSYFTCIGLLYLIVLAVWGSIEVGMSYINDTMDEPMSDQFIRAYKPLKFGDYSFDVFHIFLWCILSACLILMWLPVLIVAIIWGTFWILREKKRCEKEGREFSLKIFKIKIKGENG